MLFYWTSHERFLFRHVKEACLNEGRKVENWGKRLCLAVININPIDVFAFAGCLRRDNWQLGAEVFGQPINPIFKGEAVPQEKRQVTSQKSKLLILYSGGIWNPHKWIPPTHCEYICDVYLWFNDALNTNVYIPYTPYAVKENSYYVNLSTLSESV